MLPFLHLVADEKWHWALNQRSKYIQLVLDIDTREGGLWCNAYDRDGFMITLEQLKFQYAAERQPSPTPV